MRKGIVAAATQWLELQFHKRAVVTASDSKRADEVAKEEAGEQLARWKAAINKRTKEWQNTKAKRRKQINKGRKGIKRSENCIKGAL